MNQEKIYIQGHKKKSSSSIYESEKVNFMRFQNSFSCDSCQHLRNAALSRK